MKNENIFTLRSPLRDDFKIQGFSFGSGEPSLAIVGAMRGDEIEQQFIAAQMVKILSNLELEGKLNPDHEILVIPNANHFSMNIEERFWAMDGTDINRMFPGYALGETTQRIAHALFERIKDFAYGIQLASYYIPGSFIPHVRMMQTGYQAETEAAWFGLPYVYVKSPRPFDTTILNYNWQVWNCKAFSLYAGQQRGISLERSSEACQAILRFMHQAGLIKSVQKPGFVSAVIHDQDLKNVKAAAAGVFYKIKGAGAEVEEGEVLAHILHPYTSDIILSIKAPCAGSIFFAYEKPLALQNTVLYKII